DKYGEPVHNGHENIILFGVPLFFYFPLSFIAAWVIPRLISMSGSLITTGTYRLRARGSFGKEIAAANAELLALARAADLFIPRWSVAMRNPNDNIERELE